MVVALLVDALGNGGDREGDGTLVSPLISVVRVCFDWLRMPPKGVAEFSVVATNERWVVVTVCWLPSKYVISIFTSKFGRILS